MAMGVFTATLSVSSGTKILARMPSSMASTSIVALSVSISASTSPGFTLSPSFFSHFASLPCSMVGERAGMRMSIAIGDLFVVVAARGARRALEQNVGVELGHVGLRIVSGELRRLVHDLAHLAI